VINSAFLKRLFRFKEQSKRRLTKTSDSTTSGF